MTERTVAATVHGRYLVVPPANSGPAPMLVGFHGYGEDAEAQVERLRSIPESARWLCVSIQAPHPFYQRRTNRVVASWMTRQDRELAITDNTMYVKSCIEAAATEWPTVLGPKIYSLPFAEQFAIAPSSCQVPVTRVYSVCRTWQKGREQWNVSVGKHKNSGGVWHGRRNMVEAGGEAPQLRGSGCGRYRRVVGISFAPET